MALLSVADALARVLDNVAPLPVEDVRLADAAGRVLAIDLAARRTQPPDDVSAMDGYAVRAADIAAVPVRLTIIGEVAAGRPFAGEISAGQAARIFTGGVLPLGADTVVIQEHTSRDGDQVVVEKPTALRRNVRDKGLDFRTGDVLLTAGSRLTDRDLALAAAMNYPTLKVSRAPVLAILATGDELIAPGGEPGPGQIIYSNGFAIAALARRAGAQVIDLGVVPDDVEATIAALRQARTTQADVLITTGGASVGDYDLMHKALAAEGLDLSFWKVALRPGRPMMHGKLGAMQVLGLPGNPVSAYVCAVLFLVPLLRRLTGATATGPFETAAVLGCDLPANDERADYMRAAIVPGPDGLPVATPSPVQDSSVLRTLARADGLLIRSPHAVAARRGDPCRVIKFDL